MEIILDILWKAGRLLIDVIKALWNFIHEILNNIYEKFLDVSLPEKIVFLNSIPAFLAIILPVARFHVITLDYHVNNTLAVYMLAIVAIMFVSIYFSGRIKLAVRIIVNVYYLFWIIYLPLAGELTKADPHVILSGYYVNIAVPVIYIGASLFCYFYSYD